MAAERAANKAVHSIYKKRQRLAQNAIALHNIQSTLDKNISKNEQTPLSLQQFIFMGKGLIKGGKNINVTSAEELSRGIFQDHSRNLAAAIQGAGKEVQAFARIANLFGDRKLLNPEERIAAKQYQFALLKELFGENTGIAPAKELANIWEHTAENLRQQLNDAGFDIPKRKDWHMPQNDEVELIATAGRNEWLASLSAAERAKARLFGTNPSSLFSRKHWINDVWNTQDRSQYLNLDGSVMNDAQYRQALEATRSQDKRNISR